MYKHENDAIQCYNNKVLNLCNYRCKLRFKNFSYYNNVHIILRHFDDWTNVKRSMIINNKLVYTSCLTNCRTTSDL